MLPRSYQKDYCRLFNLLVEEMRSAASEWYGVRRQSLPKLSVELLMFRNRCYRGTCAEINRTSQRYQDKERNLGLLGVSSTGFYHVNGTKMSPVTISCSRGRLVDICLFFPSSNSPVCTCRGIIMSRERMMVVVKLMSAFLGPVWELSRRKRKRPWLQALVMSMID